MQCVAVFLSPHLSNTDAKSLHLALAAHSYGLQPIFKAGTVFCDRQCAEATLLVHNSNEKPFQYQI